MNVLEYLETIEVIPSSIDTWKNLVDLRAATFQGFAEIEQHNGFIKPTVTFHSARGQDTIRLMGYRVIEELTESARAGDSIEHRLEELIDAFNYLISIPLLDPVTVKRDQLVLELSDEVDHNELIDRWGNLDWFLTDGGYGWIVQELTWVLGDTLRNRAWMNHAQDLYFSSGRPLLNVIGNIGGTIISCFENWEQFYRYYLAKDQVLQFRLRTKY